MVVPAVLPRLPRPDHRRCAGPCRDATSLAHQYEVYARQLELSVVDNVLLVSGQGKGSCRGEEAWAGGQAVCTARNAAPPGASTLPAVWGQKSAAAAAPFMSETAVLGVG